MDEEQRDEELGSLSAIFPEIELDKNDPHTLSLEIPVKPNQSVTVYFPAANEGLDPAFAPVIDPTAPPPGGDQGQEDSHQLEYLPSIRLQVTLPKGYPETEPPKATISTFPPWLPQEVAKRLEDDAPRLWEDFGQDLIVFSYIDQIQQAAEVVFGLVNDHGALQVDSEHKIAILDHDINAKRETFNKGTFDCGICIEPKKGIVCHSMTACGHVFCKACLCDFYNNAIQEGDLASVRCLEPNCGKEREAAHKHSGKKGKPKLAIAPGELLQISLEQPVVQRYVRLKYKNELESDQSTVYCPRPWCGGAARSNKHKKPQGLESNNDDDDSEVEEKREKVSILDRERLAVCEDCGFAFCAWCKLSWHGEFVGCAPRRDDGVITDEEQASLDYLRLHTSPCPTCAAPVQKTRGCNHMICYRCQTHFCYLCSWWLNGSNPYQHYNEQANGSKTACYMRLWELEEGDGPNEDFRRPLPPRAVAADDRRPANPPVPPPAPIIEIEEPDDDDDVNGAGARNGDARQPEVAREGPLVLRIAGLPIPPPAPAPPAPPAPAPRADAGFARRRGGRGGHIGRARRGRAQREAEQGNPAGIIPRDMPRGPGPRRVLGRGPAVQNLNDEIDGPGVVNGAVGDWIRNFVQLAMEDEEHFPDSEDEEESDEEEVIILPRNQR